MKLVDPRQHTHTHTHTHKAQYNPHKEVRYTYHACKNTFVRLNITKFNIENWYFLVIKASKCSAYNQLFTPKLFTRGQSYKCKISVA